MALEQLNVGSNITLTWLDGGDTFMDGGAMFGVVPKPLWSRKYPVNERNQIELRCDPVLVQMDEQILLVDSGIGRGRLSEKALRNYGVTGESRVEENLAELGLTPADITDVVMTHMHFDHACGLVAETEEGPVPAFPNAVIHVNETEWDEMRNPNMRSKNTYFKENWEPVEQLVRTYTDTHEPAPGVRMIHTGGHSAGHAIIRIEGPDSVFWHMADIMPTHAHQNALWVLAYDDYPMDSIYAKQKYVTDALKAGDWFFFYHDYKYRAIRWDETGKEVQDAVKRKAAAESPSRR